VVNEGAKATPEGFEVMVRVEPAGEEPFGPFIIEPLAPDEKVTETFAKPLTCEESGLIVAEIDPEQQVAESEEGDNTESVPCEPPESPVEGKERTPSEGESTTSSVVTPPHTQEP
jgi:hypothetical protein